MGRLVIATPRPLHPRELGPVPTVQEALWGPGQVWTGVENLATTRNRPPDLQPVASRHTDWAILDPLNIH
jgi:hypothetical protein